MENEPVEILHSGDPTMKPCSYCGTKRRVMAVITQGEKQAVACGPCYERGEGYLRKYFATVATAKE